MKPIMRGARGPAVDDIQKRLLVLGYDLGPTGIDGVFMGKTWDAIVAFQARHSLSEDGVVGDETWSALVDSTFTLGDRTLYLRLPYFHGKDVADLQRALSTLGFSCGDADGIFGTRAESAVREFQRNCGQGGDGIVGADTVRAVMGLRHVWEGKGVRLAVSGGEKRAFRRGALLKHSVSIIGSDPGTREIADRLVNVARARDDKVLVDLGDRDVSGADLVIELIAGDPPDDGRVPQVRAGRLEGDGIEGRIVTALSALCGGRGRMAIVVDLGASDDEQRQRMAVAILDSLCSALA